MVERVEHLRAEIELEPFAQLERLGYAEVHVPVALRDENVAPRAVRSGSWDRERAGVWEDHRPGDSGFFLQFRLDRLNDVGARDMREVRRSDAAGDAEWLASHKREDAVESPTPDHCVQDAVSGVQPFALAGRKLPNATGREYVSAVEVRSRTLTAPVANVGRSARIGRGQTAAR